MRTFKALPLAVVLIAASVRTASADGFFTPYVGFNFGGDSSNCATLSNCEDKSTNIGVSFGSMGPVFGYEMDLAYAKDFYGKRENIDNSVLTWMNNMLVGVGVGPVQPYFLVGFGVIRPKGTLDIRTSIGDFSKNSIGYDVGGGVNGYFSRHVGIRGDLRRFQTMQEVPILGALAGTLLSNEKLSFWRASIGLALR